MAEEGRVKICGLCRREDVSMADGVGADYLGAVLTAGFSRSVERNRVGGLMDGVEARPVAVLVDEDPRDAVSLATELGARVVQLHGEEAPSVAAAVAEAGPWDVWKAVRVRRPDDVGRAVERYGTVVDGVLLEGWKEGVVGGGGIRLQEALAHRVAAEIPSDVDFILAGGLTADTVFDAVARFGPRVVDVSSGVERAVCRKDPEQVRRFVLEARRAWREPTDPRHQHDSGATQ